MPDDSSASAERSDGESTRLAGRGGGARYAASAIACATMIWMEVSICDELSKLCRW